MSKNILHIMVINWKWDDSLGFPSGKIEKDELSFSFSKELDFIKVTRKEKIKEEKIGEEVEFTIDPNTLSALNKYILPVKIKLTDYVDDQVQLAQAALINILEQIKKFSKGKLGEEVTLKIEFLLHRKDGFDKIDTLFEVIKPYQENKNIEIVFGYYTIGIDPIYDDDGLISEGQYFFQYKEDEEGVAGYFDKNFVPKFIFENKFDYVWNHYWYLTLRKIEKFRELILLSQVPNSSNEVREKALLYAHHFLNETYLSQAQTSTFKKEDMIFKDCVDLKDKVAEKNEKFSMRKEFKNQLIAFRTNNGKLEQDNLNELNKSFDNLMHSLYT
ncbi:MAG: hypothetical protein AAF696_30310 [Bacteroidota bacterium]